MNDVAVTHPPGSSSEVWVVQVAVGDVRVMTLDELDAAFQADRIGEETLVLQPGSMQWEKLGHLAGIDTAGASVSDERVDVTTDPTPRQRGGFFGTATAVIAIAVIAIALTASAPVAAGVADGARTSIAAVTGAGDAIARPVEALHGSAAPAVTQALTAPATITLAPARPAPAAKRTASAKPELQRPAAKPVPVPVEDSPFHEGGDDHDPLNSKL